MPANSPTRVLLVIDRLGTQSARDPSVCSGRFFASGGRAGEDFYGFLAHLAWDLAVLVVGVGIVLTSSLPRSRDVRSNVNWHKYASQLLLLWQTNDNPPAATLRNPAAQVFINDNHCAMRPGTGLPVVVEVLGTEPYMVPATGAWAKGQV
ncbi:hypothetical protein QBC45DRAFT_436466 [Copromyces sp. CBS 386.78]|nr:hypothetical protein QBC45DRAFT_436466 [Copromyces sp. CBS 386.78]